MYALHLLSMVWLIDNLRTEHTRTPTVKTIYSDPLNLIVANGIDKMHSMRENAD